MRANHSNILVKYKNMYLLKEIYDMERLIIDNINDLKENTYKRKRLNVNDFEEDETLSEEQVNSINGIRRNLISILNGPGGSGKTNKVIKNIFDYDCNESSKMIFLAPTHAAKKNGKKAYFSKKMAEAFNATVTWAHKDSGEGRTLSFARDHDIPSIYTECPASRNVALEDTDAYLNGTKNIMKPSYSYFNSIISIGR